MIITRATEYSIRAILYLAHRYPAPVVSKTEICEAEDITPAFLTKILQPLIRSGIVQSKRGVSGGFALAKDPNELTLAEIMESVEEPLVLNSCLLDHDTCDKKPSCPIHTLWAEAREKITDVFSAKTLAELAKERHPS